MQRNPTVCTLTEPLHTSHQTQQEHTASLQHNIFLLIKKDLDAQTLPDIFL